MQFLFDSQVKLTCTGCDVTLMLQVVDSPVSDWTSVPSPINPCWFRFSLSLSIFFSFLFKIPSSPQVLSCEWVSRTAAITAPLTWRRQVSGDRWAATGVCLPAAGTNEPKQAVSLKVGLNSSHLPGCRNKDRKKETAARFWRRQKDVATRTRKLAREHINATRVMKGATPDLPWFTARRSTAPLHQFFFQNSRSRTQNFYEGESKKYSSVEILLQVKLLHSKVPPVKVLVMQNMPFDI